MFLSFSIPVGFSILRGTFGKFLAPALITTFGMFSCFFTSLLHLSHIRKRYVDYLDINRSYSSVYEKIQNRNSFRQKKILITILSWTNEFFVFVFFFHVFRSIRRRCRSRVMAFTHRVISHGENCSWAERNWRRPAKPRRYSRVSLWYDQNVFFNI